MKDFNVKHMIEQDLKGRGISDPKVIKAIAQLPRHEFVPDELKASAYDDCPLSIGYGATISQPYIVALMTQELHITPKDRVLEVGCGSGYQMALLSKLAGEVYSVEVVPELVKRAKDLVMKLNLKNCHIKCGNGYLGWPDEAPFDKMILTAAPTEFPESLLEQLKWGGEVIAPVGKDVQELLHYKKLKTGLVKRSLGRVRFVPMVHKQ